MGTKDQTINPLSPEQADDQVLETTNDLSGIWAIFRFGADSWWSLTGSIVMIFVSSLCIMASARVLGMLVESLFDPARREQVAIYGACFLAFEVLFVLTQYIGRVSVARVSTGIIVKVRRELFGKLKRLPISYFDYQPLGRTITRLTSDVEGVENFFSGSLARLVSALITVIAVLVAMLVTDVKFGVLIVAVSVPALVFSFVLRKPVRYWLRAFKKRSAFVNAKFAEYLNGMPIIRIFGLEEWTYKNFAEAANSHLESALKMMHWNSFIRPMNFVLCTAPVIIVLWIGGERVVDGTLSLGLFVAFVRYAERFVSPIRAISQEIQSIQIALVSSERVRQMLVEPEEDEQLGPDGDLEIKFKGEVEYSDVWMKYERGEEVLKGINFKVSQGVKVGLVGETGSGKTTAVNLLPRLYPVKKGVIKIDGISINEWKRSSLRSQFGYVGQDVVIFGGTLRENLLGAVVEAEEISDKMIGEACKKTGLAQVIEYFDDGLDHVIVEGGENLSMGERQLVAFTRMLIKNPSILILDEATANIDERCELLIQSAVAELMQNRTCFVVAHRLSTIQQCDLIIVFSQGKNNRKRNTRRADGRQWPLCRACPKAACSIR